VELAWGDVLADGVLTINENGVQQQVDYGIPSANKVTAATLWSTTATPRPLTDLLAWYDQYVALNGIGPRSDPDVACDSASICRRTPA
jgi:hypothetical protein